MHLRQFSEVHYLLNNEESVQGPEPMAGANVISIKMSLMSRVICNHSI